MIWIEFDKLAGGELTYDIDNNQQESSRVF